MGFCERFSTGLAVIVVAILGGCSAGSGEGLDENGRPLGTGGGPGPLIATFQSIQDNVFTPVCTVCHAGAGAPQGLRLDEGNSFGLLVGVPSAEVPAILRVAPGDPDNSYLIQKLEGTAAVGGQMPLGGPALPQADIDVIRQWITDGALPTQNTPGTAAFAVVSVSPARDERMRKADRIVVVFSHEIDVSTLNTYSVLVRGSGGDGTFGDGNETKIAPVSVTIPSGNPRVALIDLTSNALPADAYRVTVSGSGPNPVLDVSGRAVTAFESRFTVTQ